MLFLIGLWATLLFITTVIVRRSVRSSTEKFEAELAAVGSGVGETGEVDPDLVLDPTSARLQIALRDFLRSQRRRQAEVADRLAHTDQLASLGQLAAGGNAGTFAPVSDPTTSAKEARRASRPASRRQSVGEAMLKSAARSVGRSLGSRLIRGILGSLLK